MKKAALTFGLFSLVMVATSFTTPETNFSSNSKKLAMQAEGGDDVATGRNQGRKLDFHSNDVNVSKFGFNQQSEGFRQERQSQGNTIKLD